MGAITGLLIFNVSINGSAKQKCKSVGIFTVETAADDAGKGLRQVGLLQVVQMRIELEVFAQRVRAVAAGKNHLELGLFEPEPVGQFAPVEAAGHDDVGEDEVNFVDRKRTRLTSSH